MEEDALNINLIISLISNSVWSALGYELLRYLLNIKKKRVITILYTNTYSMNMLMFGEMPSCIFKLHDYIG